MCLYRAFFHTYIFHRDFKKIFPWEKIHRTRLVIKSYIFANVKVGSDARTIPRGYRRGHNSTLISKDTTRGGDIFLALNVRTLRQVLRASSNNLQWNIIVTCAIRNCWRTWRMFSTRIRHPRSEPMQFHAMHPTRSHPGINNRPSTTTDQAFCHVAIPDNEWQSEQLQTVTF